LRGTYGIASPAPICPDPGPGGVTVDPSCQIVVAPSSSGERLVADTSVGGNALTVGNDGEIRLTYAQLTELIDEAVKQLVQSK